MKRVKEGDELEVNIMMGEIRNLSTGELMKARLIPQQLRGIIGAGRIIAWIKSVVTSTLKKITPYRLRRTE
jgi:hypothetical protein